jgi:hypothetical protein
MLANLAPRARRPVRLLFLATMALTMAGVLSLLASSRSMLVRQSPISASAPPDCGEHRTLLVLAWSSALRMQTHSRADLLLSRPALAASPRAPLLRERQLAMNSTVPRHDEERVRWVYRGEFGFEMLAFGAAFFRRLAGSAVYAVGCGAMGSFYFFASSYVSNATCERTDHANVVLFDETRPLALEWARRLDLGNFSQLAVLIDYLRHEWLPPPLHAYLCSVDVAVPSAQGQLRLVIRALAERSRHGIVVVSNKFANAEWGQPAVQFLSVRAVEALVDLLVANGHAVVYNHPPSDAIVFDRAGPEARELGDRELLRRRTANSTDQWHGRVSTVEDVAAAARAALARTRGRDGGARAGQQHAESGGNLDDAVQYNDALLLVMAQALCLVSVQGGSSWLSAHFGLHQVILHVHGDEGQYGLYSSMFPLLSPLESLTPARDESELLAAVKALARSGRCAVGDPCDGIVSPALSACKARGTTAEASKGHSQARPHTHNPLGMSKPGIPLPEDALQRLVRAYSVLGTFRRYVPLPTAFELAQ